MRARRSRAPSPCVGRPVTAEYAMRSTNAPAPRCPPRPRRASRLQCTLDCAQPCIHNERFQDRRIRPLCHPSEAMIAWAIPPRTDQKVANADSDANGPAVPGRRQSRGSSATGPSRATRPPASPTSPSAPRRAGRLRGCRCSACPCSCWHQGERVAATCRGRRPPSRTSPSSKVSSCQSC